MNHSTLIASSFALLLQATFAEQPAQKSPEIVTTPGGQWSPQWQGSPHRIYFAQKSPNLKAWTYVPEIRFGPAPHQLANTPLDQQDFFRLQYYDDGNVADLEGAKRADLDRDALSNWDEITAYLTDPDNPDSDNDTLPDGWEVAHGINPLDNGTINPRNGPNARFPGTIITNRGALTAGVQAVNGASLSDLDADGLANALDASPTENKIDWPKSTLPRYVVMDLNMRSLGSVPAGSSTPIIRAVLNNAGQIVREPELTLAERTPHFWNGTNFPPTWTSLPDFAPGTGESITLSQNANLSLKDDGTMYKAALLTQTFSSAPTRSHNISLTWASASSAPTIFGTYPNQSSITRIVTARFSQNSVAERTLDNNQTILSSFITAPNLNLNTSSFQSPTLEGFNTFSYAPNITRTGKVLINRNNTFTVHNQLTPPGSVIALTTDPKGRELITTINPLDSTASSTSVFRSGRWETMPMPVIIDMNAAGLAIVAPGDKLWINGATILLNQLFAETPWTEFKAEQINAKGQILCSAKLKTSSEYKAVLLNPLEFVTPAGDPVSQPQDSGRGQNEFTFSSAKPGVLEVTLEVNLQGAGGMSSTLKNKFNFEVDPIGDSNIQWNSANPNGKPTFNGNLATARVKYTNLPKKSADFGKKLARLRYEGIELSNQSFEVFFAKSASNYPNAGSSKTPNWFQYWREGNVCGIPQDAIFDGTDDFIYGYVYPGFDTKLRLGNLAAATNSGPEEYISNITVPGSSPPRSYGRLTVTGKGRGHPMRSRDSPA